jgi:hypothetical protein
MNKLLYGQATKAINKGLTWLKQHEKDISQISDLSAHYKAPYLYAAIGSIKEARRYAGLMKNKYLQKDGDFRTTSLNKGWEHLPCSPANRYVYSNGWIIVGLRRLGFYGTAGRAMEFVRRFQSEELGGFYSRFDVKSGKIDTTFLDSSSTSSAGLALLSCGYMEEARKAGDFILRMLDEQTDKDCYYSSWKDGSGLMVDIWGDDDQNSVRGRKQYCLSFKADSSGELIWLIGKPMKFLCKLYDQTFERKYLDGAIKLFDFFHKLDEYRWNNLSSCKVMWACSEIFRHTGERRFAETAEELLELLCKKQYPSGIWVNTLWNTNPEDQSLSAALDLVQELCGEFADTLFELEL